VLSIKGEHDMNAISVIKGFAEASARMSGMTEREEHRDDECPVGTGWVRTKYDPVLKIAVWERTRLVKAASDWRLPV
jgi:hypothetical protein